MTKITTDKASVVPWVSRQVSIAIDAQAPAGVGLERDGALVAGVIYTGWNGRSLICHVAVHGLLTPAYMAAIFHYPFVHCGADKIIAPVIETNAESRRFVTKLGFVEEARIADAHPDGAIIIYTMRRAACRFIGERYAQRLKVA